MTLTRIATWKTAAKGYAIILTVDGHDLKLEHTDLVTYDTAKKVEDELSRQASVSAAEPPAIYVHVNRDGSLALATGSAPEVWPEDEVDPDG